jgi:hypothetical protein
MDKLFAGFFAPRKVQKVQKGMMSRRGVVWTLPKTSARKRCHVVVTSLSMIANC